MLKDNCLCLSGKEEKILVNPGKEMFSDKKNEYRVVLFTREELDFLGLTFEGVVIRGPGEYEVGGVEISGVDGNGDGLAYLIGLDEVAMVVVDGAGGLLSKKLVDKMKGVDVMVVMVRKGEKVDPKTLLAVAKKWGVNYLVIKKAPLLEQQKQRLVSLSKRLVVQYFWMKSAAWMKLLKSVYCGF